MNLQAVICACGIIFMLNLSLISGQNEFLSCNYLNSANGYGCDLTIINPNGFNSFSRINGTHLTGMTDDDVRIVSATPGSNTSNIPSIICKKFPSTLRIVIVSSGIRRIDEDSFQNCKQLTHLDLLNNKIRQFHKNAFKENLELIQLLLWFNEITELPEDLFVNLQKLIRLDFEANKISKLPENIFKPLTSLDILYLEKNLIEELPMNAFNTLQNMTTLVIYSNKLKIIHGDSFGMLPKLKTVSIYSNQIDAIDEAFIINTGISRLDVRYNLCIDKDIVDATVLRIPMRTDLRQCFENYQEMMTGCVNGNLDERVCKIEFSHKDVADDVKILKEENEKMRLEIININNQNRIFTAAIKELENKFFEIKGCCGC